MTKAKTRKAVLAEEPEEIAAAAVDDEFGAGEPETRKGHYKSPGFPLFPSKVYRWIKMGYEPNYVRIYKICGGQRVLAEWFQGDPQATSVELLSELWGRGRYVAMLMCTSDGEHGIERIFQNSHVLVEVGSKDLPFPGKDRSPENLADNDEDDEDGEGDDDSDKDRDKDKDKDKHDEELPRSRRFGLGERMSSMDRPIFSRDRDNSDEPMPDVGHRPAFIPNRVPPAPAPVPPPVVAPPKPTISEIISVGTPIAVALASAWGSYASSRAAAEERAQTSRDNMMMAMMTRSSGGGSELTEIRNLLREQRSAPADSALAAQVQALTAEVSRMRERGGSGLNVDQLTQAMSFLEKIGAGQSPESAAGGSDFLGSLMKNLAPALPAILQLLRSGAGGAGAQQPQQMQGQAPPQIDPQQYQQPYPGQGT